MVRRPEDILPDGVEQAVISGVDVRKGTIAAFVENARQWSAPNTEASVREELECAMINSLPALRVLGVFDVFTPHDERLKQFINTHSH